MPEDSDGSRRGKAGVGVATDAAEERDEGKGEPSGLVAKEHTEDAEN